MLAEDTIHLTDDEAEKLNLKQYEFPSESGKYKVIGKIKVNRKTIENDEKPIDSNKE